MSLVLIQKKKRPTPPFEMGDYSLQPTRDLLSTHKQSVIDSRQQLSDMLSQSASSFLGPSLLDFYPKDSLTLFMTQ